MNRAMNRLQLGVTVGCLLGCSLVWAGSAGAVEKVEGTYVEARTCQVYTGPCFANGEVGSTGKDAIMTWRFSRGRYAGEDLTDRCVAVIVKASNTLGFNGLADSQETRAMIIVDAQASQSQAEALRRFAMAQTALQAEQVVDFQQADIEMQFDFGELTASVTVGKLAKLNMRKARKGDCICSNESAYYPPLTELKGFVPGVTIEGDVTARELGKRWSIPDSRTAYLGTFQVVESSDAVPASAEVATKL